MSDDHYSAFFEAARDLPPFPTPSPDWSKDDPSHPGFAFLGLDNTPGQKAYFIHLEAKLGKEEDLAGFLHDIHRGVLQEPLTGPWFALRYSKSTFAIFEAFPHVDARHEHDRGPGGTNFGRSDFLLDVLAYPAQIYRVDVLFGKTGVSLGKRMQEVE